MTIAQAGIPALKALISRPEIKTAATQLFSGVKSLSAGKDLATFAQEFIGSDPASLSHRAKQLINGDAFGLLKDLAKDGLGAEELEFLNAISGISSGKLDASSLSRLFELSSVLSAGELAEPKDLNRSEIIGAANEIKVNPSGEDSDIVRVGLGEDLKDVCSQVVDQQFVDSLRELNPEARAKAILERLGQNFNPDSSNPVQVKIAKALLSSFGIPEDIIDAQAFKSLFGEPPKPEEAKDETGEVEKLRKQLQDTEAKLKEAEESTDRTQVKLNKGNAVDYLFSQVEAILSRELKDSSSFIGLASKAISSAKQMGAEDKVPDAVRHIANPVGFLRQHVLDPKFKTAIVKSIQGKEVDVDSVGFTDIQKKAYKVTSWSLWAINKLPAPVIEFFPLVVNVMKWALPFARFIPGLGAIISTTYPVLDEMAKFIGKFQMETEGIQKASKLIRGEKVEEDKAEKTEASEETAEVKEGNKSDEVEKKEPVGEKANDSIDHLTDDGEVQKHLDCLSGDEANDVNKILDAIKALGNSNNKKAVTPLAEIMNGEEMHPPFISEAISALANLSDHDSVGQIVGHLNHDDEGVRKAAVSAIEVLSGGSRKANVAIDSLIGLLRDEKSLDVKRLIPTALGTIGSEKAKLPLIELLQSESDEKLLQSAVSGLSSFKTPDVIKAILKFGISEKPESVQITSALNLGKLLSTPESIGVDDLRDIHEVIGSTSATHKTAQAALAVIKNKVGKVLGIVTDTITENSVSGANKAAA